MALRLNVGLTMNRRLRSGAWTGGAGEELVVEVQYFMGEDSVFYQG